MTKLRDAVQENEKHFSEIISAVENTGIFLLEGDSFKKDHFPAAPIQLKSWLNRKSWWLGRKCLPDDAFFSTGLTGRLVDGFRSLGALYHFISDALRQ